ncbi:MAG: hypothetical protein R2848_04725 [Thermomicrobiales bacterium]
MASIAQPHSVAQPITKPNTGLWSWITTIDHKRIGLMYGVSAFIFLLLGGLEALVIRAQLAKPENDLVSARATTVLHDARHHDDLPPRADADDICFFS